MASNNKHYQFIDFTYLDNLVMGDNEFKKKIINMFIDKTPTIVKSMHDFYAIEDWPALKAVTHKFKSSIDFVGAKELAEVAVRLEHNCEDVRNKAEIKKEIANVDNLCSAIYKELAIEIAIID